MAIEAGSAFVSILPSLRGFSAQLKAQLRSELRGIDPVVAEAGDRAGTTFGSHMHNNVSAWVSRIGDTIKTGITRAMTVAAIGLGALTAFGLKSAAGLEQIQIGFESLLGSAKKAADFMGELQKFAAVTPFEFAGVSDAARRILAFGDAVGITQAQVIPTLTTIGNLVSVLGGGQDAIDSVVRALGQMASKGKVSQEELLQLAEALPGFNANAAIASAMGLSVADTLKLITAGGVSAQVGINALLSGMANFKGAAGAMEKQAQTLLGVFSTFKDTLSLALTNAFQPVIPQIKSALTDVTPILGEVLAKVGPAIGNLVTAALPLVGVLSEAFSPVLIPVLNAFAEIIPAIIPALGPLGASLAGIVKSFAPLAPVIGDVFNVLASALVPVIDQLAPQITTLIPPLAELLLSFVPLIPVLGLLAADLIQVQAPLIELLALVLKFATSKAVAPAIEAVAFALTDVLDAIKPVVNLFSDLGNWPEQIGIAADLVGAQLDKLGGWFAALPGRIGGFLSDLPGILANAAKVAFERMAFAIGFGIGSIIRLWIELPVVVTRLAIQLWDQATALFHQGIDLLLATVVGGFNSLVSFFADLPSKARAAADTLPAKMAELGILVFNKAKEIGADILHGVVEGFNSGLKAAGDALKDGFNHLVSGVKSGLGIHSPSTVFAAVGEQSMAGYVKGVQDAAAGVQAATTAVVSPGASAAGGRPGPTLVQVDITGSDDDILAAFREAIRKRNGGDVQGALGTAA